MSKTLTRPVRLVAEGDRYAKRFAAGAECPKDLEAQAEEAGGFEPMPEIKGARPGTFSRPEPTERLSNTTAARRERSEPREAEPDAPPAPKETAAARKKREKAEAKEKAKTDAAVAKGKKAGEEW